LREHHILEPLEEVLDVQIRFKVRSKFRQTSIWGQMRVETLVVLISVRVDHRVHSVNKLACVHFLAIEGDTVQSSIVTVLLRWQDMVEGIRPVLRASVLMLSVELSCFREVLEYLFVH
jgi:hypothetical protein